MAVHGTHCRLAVKTARTTAAAVALVNSAIYAKDVRVGLLLTLPLLLVTAGLLAHTCTDCPGTDDPADQHSVCMRCCMRSALSGQPGRPNTQRGVKILVCKGHVVMHAHSRPKPR